jgi:hypothetical protein
MIDMKISYLVSCLALIVAAFLGGLIFPCIVRSLHQYPVHKKEYSVQMTSGPAIALEINEQTAKGWTFEQAVSESSGPIDLIFSK